MWLGVPTQLLGLMPSLQIPLALSDNPFGSYDTALGFNALSNNTTGDNNVAIGYAALDGNSTGFQNVAVGNGAMIGNESGTFNTAIGDGALYYSRDNENTDIGFHAAYSFFSGSRNTAVGANALRGTTFVRDLSTGMNTASGASALYSITSGSDNVATGESALLNNTTGSRNIAFGKDAGTNLTTGDDNIDIGNAGTADESGTIRIGTDGTHKSTFIAGVRKSPITTGVPVLVNRRGQLGIQVSSARYKEEIRPMKDASEAILSLEPVTFRYKKQLDPDAVPQFGLVAEQMAKIDPDLVSRDEEGKPCSVRYEAVNAMLLNEFLKAHRQLEKQSNEIAELKAALQAQVAKIEKVSRRLTHGLHTSDVTAPKR